MFIQCFSGFFILVTKGSYKQVDIMSLSAFTFIVGLLAILMAAIGFLRADLLRATISGFPRSKYAGWLLTALCCFFGTREAMLMNMGGLNDYKSLIYIISPLVFFGSVTCLKELLAARALGGLLCLISVPVVRLAVFSNSEYFQVITVLAYCWVIVGLVWLMAPWQFRQMHQWVFSKKNVYYFLISLKLFIGILFIYLSLNFY